MLITLGQTIAALAILANAVVYGTDISAAVITRSALRHLDDASVTEFAGWGHYYGDKRMPSFGAGGVIAVVLTLILAAAGGHIGAAVAAAVALAALLIWLACYVLIAKPINTAQTAAARSGITPANARALQDKWDTLLAARIPLQATALAALCAAVALF